MDDYDLTLQHQHDAAMQTMRLADPDRAEELLKEYFGAGSSTWTGWDQHFIDYIEEHRKTGLIYGTIGDGWHFLISVADQTGFWVCAREGMRGKGFLQPKGVAALTDVAVEKKLISR